MSSIGIARPLVWRCPSEKVTDAVATVAGQAIELSRASFAMTEWDAVDVVAKSGSESFEEFVIAGGSDDPVDLVKAALAIEHKDRSNFLKLLEKAADKKSCFANWRLALEHINAKEFAAAAKYVENAIVCSADSGPGV